MHSPAEGNRDILWPVQPSQPCTESAETQAVGQEVACDDQGLPGHSKKPPSCKGTDSVPPRQPFLLSKPCLSQGQREPRGTAMLPVTHILAFGAWLVVQSMAATSGPNVTIYLQPPGVIPLGGSATIHCECQYNGGSFVLYRNGQQFHTWKPHGSRVNFSISNATQSFSGPYSCHYLHGDDGAVLARSDTLEVLVQESQLPRPSISVMPWDGAILGTPATILCKCPCQGTAMLLYKAGNISAWKRAQVVRNMATFTIARVDQEDGGTYICRYGNESDPSNLSQPSHSVELLVKDPGLARPSLFLEPRGHVRPGTNATLLCTGVGQSAQVYFWMDRKMIKKTETKGNVATFVLPHVMGHHGGTYACTYHSRKQPYLSSELSNTVWLVVADYTWGNTVRLALGAGILILLGLIVAEAMHSHRPTLGHLGTL
ncbi:T-cell-interacting, activating receptor on myeloid cells protein 1 isoform X3 [Struthio camelus]|uniref:T-cell-interacting, activating receptor on myeloid cells protein 1 isoform X3 n=1 Tax=Struthio camelus TaxID=8801 RepID=UPI00051E5B60|nr:PREDICTED: leukocyte immunoglobulin-like receptor subfamily A member 2 isoform X2 [Struthio camelus australis]